MSNLRATAVALAFLFALVAVRADEQQDFFKPPPKQDKDKPPAGKAEMLRQMPKKYAAFVSADADKLQVTLHVEGEKEPKTWPINPDAEIKVHGWWGRLNQFQKGQRLWVWFAVDRKRQPKSILMLADEISQQDINGTPVKLEAIGDKLKTLTIKPGKGDGRVLRLGAEQQIADASVAEGGVSYHLFALAEGKQAAILLSVGQRYHAQTAGDELVTLILPHKIEVLRSKQRDWLRQRWIEEGLPGTVAFLHPLAGEFEFMLDHEAMRWGRSLKKGDKVTLKTANPIETVVKEVAPWREKTRLTLVADGFVQSELSPGQRLKLHMPTPSEELDNAELPPDIDRPRAKEERIDWFLASSYCSCGVKGDGCTGMFYTLASCNVNACGMPNHIRSKVAAFIDKGLTDRQIWDELKKTQGPLMLKQHLLP